MNYSKFQQFPQPTRPEHVQFSQYQCETPETMQSYNEMCTDSFKLREDREETEAESVDELVEILVECLQRSDIKTRVLLLQKFFYEIEKDVPLENFLVERVKQSKVLNAISHYSSEMKNDSMAMRDLDGSLLKLERFKVKTVNVGGIVHEDKDSK
ncbi:Uncharacterized protein Adt_34190 [Abeliophyllum distichum]|uniref:Uncharacterized protein n=1 Tax=Abeliophyllum distichum TaxID=126358 RepID=A0ABD1R205_9LAMI